MRKPVPLFARERGKCENSVCCLNCNSGILGKNMKKGCKVPQKRRHWVTPLFKSRGRYDGNDLFNDLLDGQLWLIRSCVQYQSISIPSKCAQTHIFLWCTNGSQIVFVFTRNSTVPCKFPSTRGTLHHMSPIDKQQWTTQCGQLEPGIRGFAYFKLSRASPRDASLSWTGPSGCSFTLDNKPNQFSKNCIESPYFWFFW